MDRLKDDELDTIEIVEYVLRAAKHPPVMKPDMIAFHASSFWRQLFTAQSNVENMPPQIPKLPPVTGARAFMEEMAPTKRSPCYGVSWKSKNPV